MADNVRITFNAILKGVLIALIPALIMYWISREPEPLLATLTLQITTENHPTYSATLEINRQQQGVLKSGDTRSAVSELLYQENDRLRFNTELNNRTVTFSGFLQPAGQYQGLIIDQHGNSVGHFSAQAVP